VIGQLEDIIEVLSDTSNNNLSPEIDDSDSTSVSEDNLTSLTSITTKVIVLNGRQPQGTAKQFIANLTNTFHSFQAQIFDIMKKKLGNKAPMLDIDALTFAYNWGPAKEPAKTPSFTQLEDEEDYEGKIVSFRYINR